MTIAGWDIGGAHLKLAIVEGGTVTLARQLPCALWRGLGELRGALEVALVEAPACERHAVTMTGELADLFPDRATGVADILETLAGFVPGTAIRVYGSDGAFLSSTEAAARPERVASANWHATARYLAGRLGDGLLVDIGSTTTDIVPFRVGRVAARGASDAERLASGELLYTGIVRTPLAAVARSVPFAGGPMGVMAELFATMADAHRLAGTLPEGADLHEAADGRGKSLAESRVRLARMIGMDAAAASDAAWRGLAETFLRRQAGQLEEAAALVLSAIALPPEAPVIGAGSGRFLAAELARRLRRPYRAVEEMLPVAALALAPAAADIAPAVAVALLLA